MAFQTDADSAATKFSSLDLAPRHRAAAAASLKAAPDQRVAIPGYLLKVYWWTYVHPIALAVFDHLLVVNLILLGNYNRLRDRALALFDDAPKTVLQISCAYGDITPRLVSRLAPTGGRLDVIDVLAIQLRNVGRKLRPTAPVRLMNMNATALALPSAAYDRVMMFFLLHEQPADVREKTLAEALRVVKPGGTIVVTDFARPYRWNPFRYLWAMFLTIFEPFALDLWRNDIATMLPADCGATVEVTRYFGGLFQVAVVTRAAE